MLDECLPAMQAVKSSRAFARKGTGNLVNVSCFDGPEDAKCKRVGQKLMKFQAKM